MAEFVNWDKTEQAHFGSGDQAPINLDFQPVQENQDFDLALANIDGDDFSYWALEHFETSTLDPVAQLGTATGPAGLNLCEFNQTPCDACEASGFSCKRIDEDQCKDSCTTCVALDITCSFAVAATSRCGLNNTLLEDVQQTNLRSSSSPDLANVASGTESGHDNSPKPPAVPKIGARFSRDSVRILKTWLSTHSHRPYPNDEERENLQRQTGLNKTQIANWLANARRRSKGKFQPTRSTSPSVRGYSGAIEIPKRRATPALESECLSPLQRWQNSPPENEPASVSAIASAILQSHPCDSGLNSPFTFTDDDAARSCKSSASSFGTSPSSGSFASGHSRGSRGSFGSFQQRGRRRRRRRTVPNEAAEEGGLKAPPKTFQCTFCTETFRTKHDWQRHEKSLHLSLERWICCPKGPRALNTDMDQLCCVFCGKVDPDKLHTEGHNHTSCQERSLDERTFYRKDHLRQHLKLVHNAKYLQWSMDAWKVPTPDIRSRCGFCGHALPSWSSRVDHLAEHFKTGSDMRAWKGDWGFEPAVLSMVENAIPPYVINDERNTPLPFQAGRQPSESPRNAYELIKLELTFYLQNRRDASAAPASDDDLQYEACRIIYASEVRAKTGLASQTSWLRDLFMSSDKLSFRAQMDPLRSQTENFMSQLRVIGKDSIFEGCPTEMKLAEFVKARTMLGLTTTDGELQVEACDIVGRMEEASAMPSEEIANFLLRLIHKDSSWLTSFRQRAGLPATGASSPSGEKHSMALTIHNDSELEKGLAEFVRNQRARAGVDPSDDLLRKLSRQIVYQDQDTCQQTAADNAEWLTAFKRRHLQGQSPQKRSGTNDLPSPVVGPLVSSSGNSLDDVSKPMSTGNSARGTPLFGSIGTGSAATPPSANYAKWRHWFVNGSDCYRQLARELGRFVASATSPNNPNQHVPTDRELQHQARWILFDDDDPFNRTAADNSEWLLRFKRSVGIPDATGDGGSPSSPWPGTWGGDANQWRDVSMSLDTPASGATVPSGAQPMELDNGAPNIFDLGPVEVIDVPPVSNPGLVFANQDFEDKLIQFAVSEVASSGRMPADEALQARAKEISGLEVWQAQTTAVDDPILLAKFKTMVVERVKAVLGGHDDGVGHQKPHTTTISPLNLTPDRGQDAIDPGLLPALESGVDVRNSERTGAVDVQVAISETRLDEIITEALGA